MIAPSVAKLKMFSPESEIFSLNKAKKRRKEKLFCGKFGSMPTFRSTRKGNVIVMYDHMVNLSALFKRNFFPTIPMGNISDRAFKQQ